MYDDKLHDECGVVGVYGAQNSAALVYFGLVSLQHRGQESAGIAVSDGQKIHLKNNGCFKHCSFVRLYEWLESL